MKEWMAHADPPKEASLFERMNGRPQLLFSNKMTHHFIEWMTPGESSCSESHVCKSKCPQILFQKVYYT